jgi:predicted lipoprotein with Yx(FWY)xxD motif
MTRSRPMTFLAGAAVIPLAALVVAGCGGGGGGASASTTPPKTTSPISARGAVVRVANSRLGKILVDSQGRTLYLFQKDSGKKSACTGPCAAAWPPLRANGKPTVGSGAKASLVGTTTRSDGGPQVTYNGHPLYTFVKDKKAGDTNGEGKTAFGGRWYAVSPTGKPVLPKTVSHQASTSSSGQASTSSNAPPAQTSPPPAAQPAPPPPPAAAPAPQPSPPSSGNGIPQNGGGDGDADNNGGPSDGDGGV